MKLFEKKNVIRIDEDDLRDAKLSSMDFIDDNTQKRVFIDILGARLAMKMLFEKKIQASNLYSLYTIHNVIEELDIADIYFQGIKMDVRLVFNSEEIFIPKSHFEYGLLPDLYLVLELKEDLSSADFIGFFEPKILNQQNANKDFYFHEADRLNAPSNLKTFLEDFIVENNFDIPEDNIENTKELFLSLVDKEISKNDKHFLFEQLAKSSSLREQVVEFENFELISREVAKNEDMFKDGVLDIVGAQKIFDEIMDDGEFGLFAAELDSEFFDTDETGQLAAEIAIAGAIAGGVANLAAAGLELEAALAQNSVDNLTAGIELGAELVKEGTEFISETVNLGSEIFEPEAENIQSEIEDMALLEYNLFGDIETQTEEFEELPEFELLEDSLETFNDNLPTEEQYFDTIENEEQESNQNEEVLELNDFDLNMPDGTDENFQNEAIDDVESFDSSLFQNEEIEQEEIPQGFKELDELDELEEAQQFESDGETNVLQRLRQLEQEEILDEDSVQEKSDEFLFQVDEFLKDVEFSDEQKEFLETSLLEAIDETETINPSQLSEISYVEHEPLDDFEQDVKSFEDDKDPLKVLFEKEMNKNVEISELENEVNEAKYFGTPIYKNKKMIIAASVASVVLASLVIGTGVFHNKNNETKFANNATTAPISAEGQALSGLQQENAANADLGQQMPEQVADSTLQQPIPGEYQQADASRDMGKAVSDAFLSEPVNASISKVAWEVPEDIAYNDTFRKYLQIAGKNLKLNLQNDLLLATEMAYSNKVIVDLVIKNDGSLQSEEIAASSGSKQIDKIVLQSVKETLKYLKMPSSELSGGSATATLIINF